MDILKFPSDISLSGNMQKCIISTPYDISFVLKDNTTDEVVIEHSYSPSADHLIEVDLKPIIQPLLAFHLQNVTTVYKQPDIMHSFTVEVAEVVYGVKQDAVSRSFKVIRTGVDELADAPLNFLKSNFLTWQPNVKGVTYYSPEFLAYYASEAVTVKCTAYFPSAPSATSDLASLSANTVWTIPVSYSVVASKFDGQFPSYYDIWIETPTGNRLTYIQRYYADDMKSPDEQWVLFENSLGGIDTFRAYGNSNNTAEHTHNIAEIEEDSQEYRVDTERSYSKNTGHLDKKERLWLLDFFPSLGKYIYLGNHLRRIVVTESDVNYTAKDLPSSYTFTYKYADARPYLNIPRTDTPQDVLNISVPDLGSFTVAPRLVEFPRLTLSDGALLPIQDPNSESWAATSLAALKDFVLNGIQSGYDGDGGIGHSHPNLSVLNVLQLVNGYLTANGEKISAGYADKAGDLADYSALDNKYLRKDRNDIAKGIITFLQGTNWGNFTSETGAAMTVDPNTGQTYMEVDRLKVRLKAFFEHLEVQKVGFVGGKLIVTKGQGVDILDVENIYDSEGNVSAYRCYFLGEQEGRKIDNLLRVKDQMICKDFNVSEGTTDGATNKYYWRLATAVSSDVVKRGNNVCHWVDLSATDCDTNSDIPEIGDTICHLGNREDTDRQGAEILSVVDANSPSFTIYSGINSYSLVNKEYIDMGVVNGKAYCNIYGSTYIGDRDRQNGYLRWNDDKKTFEIKGTIDITSPLSSGGTIGSAIVNAANAYKGEYDAFTSNVNDIIGGFQAQIDGVIETWFYEPEPTLGNEPAVNWTDNATKDMHLGDLYYSGEGLAYRFQKEGDNYVWKQIDDTAITKALAEAKKANDAANAAQGTADSKMRVFVVQPTADDEYSVGDMWVNATYGTTYKNDILRCKTDKSKGAAFSIDHWEKASKYTDDTAAKAAQKTANDAATAAQEINASITAIDGNVDVALKDKIITKTEAAAIKEALKGLEAIMADVNKTKKELVNNAVYQNIASDVKTDYDTAYTNLVAAYNELSKYITDTLLVANPITDEILSSYTSKYSNFKTKYEDYVSKLTVVRNSMDALLNTRIGDIATMLGGLKATTDAMNESTQINGGLILSSLLALGYTNNSIFNVMSGVSGLYESGETGGGIAFWAGGHRIDINNCTKNADGTYSIGGKVVNPADFLVRHDGTGYAAGGKMWWDENGKIHADPQSFLINEEYVGNVMQLFKFEYSGGTEFTNIVHAIPQKPFESLSVGANGLTLYNGDKSAKFYVKDGVLFLEGDLAVTGGITMYASNGVTSGLLDQVYAIMDSSKFEIKNGVITIKGDIGDGKVKGATLGGVAVTLNANRILEFDAYPTTLPASDVYAWAKAATKPTYSWGEITEKPTSFTPSAHTHDDRYYTESEIDTKLGLKLDTSLKGVANGLATLDSSGKVPSSQLPSYVDDVLEYANKASFPTKGESGKIYIDKATNLTYRWGGTAYVEISQSLALGETSSTAYAGDKGKKNADNIAALQTGKADKATTLSGYGITDAYTKTEVNTKLTDGSVTKIGTKDVGSATLPIYLKAGVPTAVGTSLAVNITGNSATATKLANARTIWGQSFDGSANVSGDMTGVGTITPTGEDLKVVGNLIVTGGIVMYADDGATIESGFAALLAAHIDGVTIKYNEAQGKIYSVMTGIKVNGATYKPSETDGYITIPDYPTSLDWTRIDNKPSTFAPSEHTHTFASLTSKPTTLSGYGITDAKIANGVITLGTATITPLTAHQKVTLASGTNNGTLKLTVGSTTTDNIAVKGLGSAAYTASSAYAAASHTHSQYLVASSLDGYVNALTDNTSTNVFVTAISKSGKTLSYTKSFTKKSLTAASHSGWRSADTDKLIIPDMSFIAYWNGAYNSGGRSNLAYCNKGAFGDMATAAKSSYYTKSDTYTKTEVNTKLTDGSVTKVGTTNVGATNIPIYLKAGVPTAVTLVDTANNLINNLTTGTSTPEDADYYVAQYVGGGTTTTTFHRRPHSALYAYIKGKAEGTWAISVSGNAATATTLQNARTLWGQSFNGSANISGNMSGVGQITFSALSGTNGRALLYQQMADNDFFRIYAGGTGNNGGYVEIATADDGTEPIYVRQYSGVFGTLVRTLTLLDGNGNTTVPGLLTAANGTINGTLKVGAIPVTNSSSGVLKIDGNLIVTGGITMYATDGVASGLMEQILVDGTTIGKKADGTLYAINTGNVRSIIMGSTTYTPNGSGAVTLPEKVTWANIEGKPSTFTPSSHIHTISQITNLQATLDGKAAASHTHSYLPLSGGTIRSGSDTPLIINSVANNSVVYFGFWIGDAAKNYIACTSSGVFASYNNGNNYPFLHTGNYNSYAPTLTGGGASGTWGISISGNADTSNRTKFLETFKQGSTTDTYGPSYPVWAQWATLSNNAIVRLKCTGYTVWTDKADYATSAGNADTVDGEHSSAFAHIGTHNNLLANGNEFNYASSGFSGTIYINYRTVGGKNGNINGYELYNGAGRLLGVIIHSGNYNSYTPTLTGTGASGTWGISVSGNAATATKSEYSRSLLGRYPSGGDCSTANGNLVFAEWDTMGDSRWYLKTTSYECRVAYANNADTLDGYHYSSFALASHTHSYLPLSGGTLSGNLYVKGASIYCNNYLYIEAWPNYGSGRASAWYDGTEGTVKWDCNILVSGGITMYSDLRKKNILSDEVLSVKEIAAAPLFRHTYKSDDNQYIHVGTSAQYWSGIHEDWFTRKDGEGYYQMELQNLGVAMGISLAREIVKYESKTDKKIRLMKKRINELEKANESLEARVKELEERRTA